MGQDAHMIDDMAPREMYKMLKDARADIMLSGGRSQFIALKAKMPWLDINQERHYAYAGYEGMVELVRQIDKALSNPVWEQVRTKAPWDEASWEDAADAANAADAALAARTASADAGAGEAEAATATAGIDRQARICNCAEVNAGTLEDIIRARKLTTVAEVVAHTPAGRTCGCCQIRIAGLLDSINDAALTAPAEAHRGGQLPLAAIAAAPAL
jgi:nitrogenase molybdenum-cofactor synthesis protein NifE